MPRVLGPWIASAVVVGTVIGSGVFKKGQKVAEAVPESGLAIGAWVLVGVLTLFGALVLAEVAVRYPRAGGNYQFLKEAYGPLFGFLWGWVEFWIIRPASIAALITLFTAGAHDLLRQAAGTTAEVAGYWQRQGFTCGVIVVLAVVSAAGTRLGGRVQLALTVVKVGSLVGIMALPFAVLAFADAPVHRPALTHFAPVWPADWMAVDWGKFGGALVAVLWAYDGWRNIGPIAEEVERPQRNIPWALLGGVLILIALYVGANLAYGSVIPQAEMAGLGETPVATEFCRRLLGPAGLSAASAAIMVSVLGSANGNVFVGPRLLFAMARDGLAPARLARVSPRTGTPLMAIAVLAVWSIVLVLGFAALTKAQFDGLGSGEAMGGAKLPKDPFDALTDFAVFGAAGLETMVIASIFILRRREPPATHPLPYRCPGYPVVPAVYVLAMGAILANMFAQPAQRTEALIGLGLIMAGAAWYHAVYRRHRSR
ncbi:MAG: amino acid permease [Verrucomicrobia bacterium]|nr:amino acid permease [Verrucomicrobiota bacterium]